MKTSAALLSLILIISAASAQTIPHKTDAAAENLHGKVKTVISLDNLDIHGYDNGKGEKTILSLVRYNTNGYKTAEYRYKNEATTTGRDTFIYNNAVWLIQKKSFYLDSTWLKECDYSYNPAGDLTEIYLHRNVDSFSTRTLVTYTGNIRTDSVFNNKNVFKHKTIFTYDRNGNVIEYATFTNSGKPGTKLVITYDDKGNKISIVQINSENVEESNETDSYNENGDIIRSVVKAPELHKPEKLTITYLSYDSNGNWTRRNTHGKQLETKGDYLMERQIEYY